MKYTKKIKTGKFTFLFLSFHSDYKITKELDLMEFTIQVLAYFCTLLNIVWGIISPILYSSVSNISVLIWINLVFGPLFAILFMIICMIYLFLVDYIFPNVLEIPLRKIKEAEMKIKSLKKDLQSSIENQNAQAIIDLLNKRNRRLLKRYMNTNCKPYFNKKLNRTDYYYYKFDLFQFCSNTLEQADKALLELKKPEIDWDLLQNILLSNNQGR